MDISELSTRFDEYTRATEAVIGDLRTKLAKVEDLRLTESDIERERREADAAYLRANGGERRDVSATPEQVETREALGALIAHGDDAKMQAIHQRSMSVGSDVDGGFLVVPALSNTMTSRIRDQNSMRKLSRVVSITSGDVFEEPLDYDESGARWPTENQTRPDTGTPKIGKLRVPVNEIYATQTVTQRLLDQSYIDIGGWIEGKISDKFARTEGVAFTSGDSIQKPQGFLTLATDNATDITRDDAKLQFLPSLSASTVTADALRNLYWAMRAPHRAQATWQMASSTANAIDKLKDGNGDYIWRDGMTAGAPPSLLGRPVEFNEDMPEISGGAFPIAFGDWQRGYVIVDQVGVRFLRDPYTDKPNVLFYVYRRLGGGVANTDAIKLLKIAAS